MRTPLALAFVVTLSTMAAGVRAEGPAPFEFSFSNNFDTPFTINDNTISQFPLVMNDPRLVEILTLELVLDGLTHGDPGDLDVYLIDPRGSVGPTPFAVMLDRGDGNNLTGAELVFASDENRVQTHDFPPESNPIALPTGDDPLVSGSVYFPDDSRGFDAFAGLPFGTDAWILLVIDDGGTLGGGSFEGFTLRGTAVPEPVTLSLLALGALFTLRRKRR